LDLDAIQALDASERPRYDYSWSGANTIWSSGDAIPNSVSWSDDYGSMSISLVQDVIDSDTWGDPAYAGFRITIDQHFFPSSFQSSATATIYAVFQVTYEGFDNVVRRRLISTRRRLEAQLDLRQTAITVQPQSSLTIDDYLDTSPDSNTDIDMTVIVTVTARLLKEYNKSPEFFIKKLEHVFSHHTGTITGEIQILYARFKTYEPTGQEVLDIAIFVQSMSHVSSSFEIANKFKYLLVSQLLITYESLFEDAEFLHLLVRPRLSIAPAEDKLSTSMGPVVRVESSCQLWRLIYFFILLLWWC